MAEALTASPAVATLALEEARIPLMDLRESVEAMPEPEFTLRDRLNDYTNKLRYTGRKAVAGITALGIGFGGVGMSLEEGVAHAQKQPVAEMASSTWSRLGGDPLRPNVDTRNEFVSLMTSGKGATAMKFAGLNAKERKAVRMGARTGNFRQCQLKYGEHFKKMSFGINGTSVDSDVTFKDPRYKNHSAPAWCEDAKVVDKNGKTVEVIHLKVPFKCGNVAIKNIVHLRHVPKHKAPKQTTPAEVCSGNTTNTSNTSGSSGTAQGGNCSINTVIVTENQTPPQSPPQSPPSHGCSVSNLIEKDGRTTNMTVTTDTNPSLETVDWGDGQSSSYGNTSSSQMETHFYNSDNTFTETVKLNFADGGSATCTGSITTQQETAPPPPAP